MLVTQFARIILILGDKFTEKWQHKLVSKLSKQKWLVKSYNWTWKFKSTSRLPYVLMFKIIYSNIFFGGRLNTNTQIASLPFYLMAYWNQFLLR